MTAFELVARGEILVGLHIMTAAIGSYPGGPAKITELYPDLQAAPEIIFQVENPDFASAENPKGSIGVFEDEPVKLLDDPAGRDCRGPDLVVVLGDAEPSA